MLPDSSDELDVGVRVQRPYQHQERRTSSPDPLDVIPPAHKPHAFETSDPPRHTLAMDGESTHRLRSKLQNKQKAAGADVVDVDADAEGEDGADPIQAASDFEPETGRHVTPHGTAMPRGNVRQKTQQIEMVVEHQKQRTQPPTIDLQTKVKAKSVKSQMRAKDQPFVTQPSSVAARVALKDPVATTSSGFTSKAKRKGKEAAPRRTTISLPLKQFAYGCHILGDDKDDPDPQWWLMYDSIRGALIVQHKVNPTQPTFVITRRLYSLFTYTEPSEGYPVIIQLVSTPDGWDRKKQDQGFQPGSGETSGNLTFKFLTHHANWANDDSYSDLVSALKTLINRVDVVRKEAAAACWHMVVAAAELWESSKVKDTKSASGGPSSRAIPVPARSRTTPKPISRTAEPNEEVPEKITRRSARLLQPSPGPEISIEPEPDAEPDELILVYPPTGAGGITINKSDLKRLGHGQYLNDTLIEFGLKYVLSLPLFQEHAKFLVSRLWLNNLRDTNPELAGQVHVFSSFFYKKLNVKSKEEGYQSVRKWTSKFDLFTKKYIIVPINEHFHWYFAIIHSPEHILAPPPPIDLESPPKPMTRKRKRESAVSETEAAKSTEIPAETTAPQEEVVPDSCPPSPTQKPTTPSADSDGEGEVAMLLEPTRSCTITDETRPPHTTDSVMSDDTDSRSSAADVGVVQEIHDVELLYPSSPSRPEPMDVDEPAPHPEAFDDVEIVDDVQTIDDGSDTSGVASTSALRESKDAVQEEAITDSVAPSSFYGSAPSKKGKERERVAPLELDEEQLEETDEPVVSDTSGSEHPTTHIFTFDSLGTKHPQVIKTLAKYLQMEAKDKKGLEHTSPVRGKAALIPSQPNFCDCGVYLLYFVRTFMQDPDRFTQLIVTRTRDYSSSRREADWGHHTVIEPLRAELSDSIGTLSDVWKKERETKEEQRKKDAEAEGKTGSTSAVSAVDSSDEEIIVGEVKQPSPKSKGKARGRQKAVAGNDDMRPAERLR
ncbi:hypothetical protein B0H21DRAFT_68615 [Amylocystis lapponica]|nr:hypothetical protein B0H21DRAFT_68615 [Amylocystis lapponica]